MKSCGLCSRHLRVESVTTDLGQIDVAMCPYCDHIKCQRCGFPDATGTSKKCASCGAPIPGMSG